MKKFIEFLHTHRHALIWTVCYVAITFLILLLLFGFNMFSGDDWVRLASARLRGFPGFVFGIMILAAVPLYIATTTVIVRTKKPLFTFGTTQDAKDESSDTPAVVADAADNTPLPQNIPTELHGAFRRARRNIGVCAESVFNRDITAPDIPQTSNLKLQTSGESGTLPLPDDFDFSVPETSAAPMFKEINFDSPGTNTGTDTDNDIIIKDGFAIATHDDADFWIADDTDWFASGKQKESPIKRAIAAAEKENLKPAICLKEKNIMDIDDKIKQWESSGITVLFDV